MAQGTLYKIYRYAILNPPPQKKSKNKQTNKQQQKKNTHLKKQTNKKQNKNTKQNKKQKMFHTIIYHLKLMNIEFIAYLFILFFGITVY